MRHRMKWAGGGLTFGGRLYAAQDERSERYVSDLSMRSMRAYRYCVTCRVCGRVCKGKYKT